MKLKQVMRALHCAAYVGTCMAGEEWGKRGRGGRGEGGVQLQTGIKPTTNTNHQSVTLQYY